MDCFYARNNGDGTFGVECKIVVYRAKLGKHPDFLKPTGDEKDGFNTKYFLLVADDIPTLKDAETKALEFNQKYSKLQKECEDSGNWDNFPFKDAPIVYYK